MAQIYFATVTGVKREESEHFGTVRVDISSATESGGFYINILDTPRFPRAIKKGDIISYSTRGLKIMEVDVLHTANDLVYKR